MLKKLHMAMLGVVMLLSPWALAQTPADELSKLLSNMQTMQADFSQTIESKEPRTKAGLGNKKLQRTNVQTVSGNMRIKRPGKFKWQMAAPMAQLVVSEGKTMWIYDEDLAQATKQTVDSRAINTPSLLFSGDPKQLAKSFNVQKQGDNVFVLQSKSSDEAFEMISIAFAGANPVQLVLKDALGQKTVVNFNKVKLNMPIDANVFKFVPPPGVDVIEQ